MIALGIESSCDDTSVCLMEGDGHVFSRILFLRARKKCKKYLIFFTFVIYCISLTLFFFH